MKRQPKIVLQNRFKKWNQNAACLEQQRVIIERDMARAQTCQVADFFQANIQRARGEIRIYDRNRAIRAAERTTFRYLQNANLSIDTFPER